MISVKEIKIHCVDGTIETKFNRAFIETVKYKTRLVRDSVHSPRAAKIMLRDNNEFTVFLLISPVILVDYKGHVIIYTTSTMAKVSLEDDTDYDAKSLNSFKTNDRLFKAKIALGLSYSEIVSRTNNEIEMEVQQLVKSLSSYKRGGGFDE